MGDVLFNRLKVLINKTYYLTKRYKVESTFAYLYHEKPISNDELGKLLRISDNFLQIDKNHFFIHYAHTNQTNSYKASQNLIYKLDAFFGDTTSCIALDTYHTSNSVNLVLNRLQRILEETKQNSYTRIEDDSILNDFI